MIMAFRLYYGLPFLEPQGRDNDQRKAIHHHRLASPRVDAGLLDPNTKMRACCARGTLGSLVFKKFQQVSLKKIQVPF